MPTAAYYDSTRGSDSLQQGSAAMRCGRSAYRTDGSSAAAMSAVDVTSVGVSRSSSLNVRTTGCMSACGRGCAVWRGRSRDRCSVHRCCHKWQRLAFRGEADFAAFCGEAALLRCRYTREWPMESARCTLRTMRSVHWWRRALHRRLAVRGSRLMGGGSMEGVM